jgi:predicted NBD/HSP70 family sugar kinase
MLVTVDTGGTKTLVASFSEDGVVRSRTKFPTPRDQAMYLSQLTAAIHLITDVQTIDAIVVALPGIVKDNIAIWCNHLGWEDFDVRTPLSASFAGIPILVENDANLGGLGEVRMLKPIPSSALYVTISTGIGTGVITDGTIDPGLRHSEGGRSLVEFDGIVREWESFAAGSAIYKAYGKYGKDIHSKRTWLQIADRISRGFLAFIPVIQPDIIIVGGSMGTHFAKYSEQLVGILQEKLPAHIPCPTFVSAHHPEEAVIYGCYFYALDTLTAPKA